MKLICLWCYYEVPEKQMTVLSRCPKCNSQLLIKVK